MAWQQQHRRRCRRSHLGRLAAHSRTLEQSVFLAGAMLLETLLPSKDLTSGCLPAAVLYFSCDIFHPLSY